MATKHKIKSGKGTLIRGADGTLYFVPDRKLPSFRLPPADSEDSGEALAAWEEIGGYSPILAVPGVRANTDGVNIKVGAARRRKRRST